MLGTHSSQKNHTCEHGIKLQARGKHYKRHMGTEIGFIWILHIVKEVVVVFHEAFSIHPSIHPSCHPSMDGIIQGRKP
jgi:hypothetical protein